VEDLVMVLTLVLLPAVAGMVEKGDVGIASLAVDMGITIGKVVGGYKIQGRGDAGQVLLDDALALEAAGAQLLVLECVPVELAKR
ncbi:3-methyl-2-oxobutanoate hydroxymethyltransferase, partial [Salmonella enterica subsp. enterica serovar Virginia]|nr:3-methyl-2-oxobutanoate hydroxymethyltransferase [Salmonella enterica subsp. enterica serovar Virginia]